MMSMIVSFREFIENMGEDLIQLESIGKLKREDIEDYFTRVIKEIKPKVYFDVKDVS